MMADTGKIQAQVPAELAEWFRDTATATGIPQAELMGKMVDAFKLQSLAQENAGQADAIRAFDEHVEAMRTIMSGMIAASKTERDAAVDKLQKQLAKVEAERDAAIAKAEAAEKAKVDAEDERDAAVDSATEEHTRAERAEAIADRLSDADERAAKLAADVLELREQLDAERADAAETDKLRGLYERAQAEVERLTAQVEQLNTTLNTVLSSKK